MEAVGHHLQVSGWKPTYTQPMQLILLYIYAYTPYHLIFILFLLIFFITYNTTANIKLIVGNYQFVILVILVHRNDFY